MKAFRLIIVIAITSAIVPACEKGPFDTKDSYNNAVFIKQAQTTIIGGRMLSKDSVLVYPINAACWEGGIPTNKTFSIKFYKEKYTDNPHLDEAFVVISGNITTGLFDLPADPSGKVDYTDYCSEHNDPNNISQINISGLDEAIGLGPNINLKIKQGNIEGTNGLIQDIRINSFKTMACAAGSIINADAEIDIVLTTKAKDDITIRFNDIILPDGWYY